MKEDLVPGGKGDNVSSNKFDKTELHVGIAVEMEHTDDKKAALEIAIDHLTENPKYYSELIKSGLVDEKPALKLAKKYGMIDNINEEFSMNSEDKKELANLLRSKGKNIKDDDIHNFAEEKGYNVHELEAYIYKIAGKKINTENKMNESDLRKIIRQEIKEAIYGGNDPSGEAESFVKNVKNTLAELYFNKVFDRDTFKKLTKHADGFKKILGI